MVVVWGKAPHSGPLAIQARRGHGWRTVERLDARRGQVFTAPLGRTAPRHCGERSAGPRAAPGASASSDERMRADAPGEGYLGDLERRLWGALGAELIALYRTGSGAYGEWAADRSDIDVIVVCREPLSRATRRRLVEPLRHRALPYPARGLELVVYDRATVAAPGPRVEFRVNLNTGPGFDERTTFDPADEPSHWFVIDLSIARARGLALIGPPPARVIGPVARADVLAALAASIDWHREHEPASADSVLNACRAWRYAVEGSWAPRDAAGR